MNFDIVIGLEIHSELKQVLKIFCGCKNEFGGEQIPGAALYVSECPASCIK